MEILLNDSFLHRNLLLTDLSDDVVMEGITLPYSLDSNRYLLLSIQIDQSNSIKFAPKQGVTSEHTIILKF